MQLLKTLVTEEVAELSSPRLPFLFVVVPELSVLRFLMLIVIDNALLPTTL